MKSNNKPTIIALSIAVLFLAGCNEKKDDSALDILNNVQVEKKAEPSQPTAVASTEATGSNTGPWIYRRQF